MSKRLWFLVALVALASPALAQNGEVWVYAESAQFAADNAGDCQKIPVSQGTSGAAYTVVRGVPGCRAFMPFAIPEDWNVDSDTAFVRFHWAKPSTATGGNDCKFKQYCYAFTDGATRFTSNPSEAGQAGTVGGGTAGGTDILYVDGIAAGALDCTKQIGGFALCSGNDCDNVSAIMMVEWDATQDASHCDLRAVQIQYPK